MSLDDLGLELEVAARTALFQADALRCCLAHPEITIRIGDEDAERHAYALATIILKGRDEMYLREDLMETIKAELDMAADDNECPSCAKIRDE